MEWFYYDNNVAYPQFDPRNYSLVLLPVCPGNSQLCAIRAFRQIIGGQPTPIITAALQTEITATLMNGEESANVLLKS